MFWQGARRGAATLKIPSIAEVPAHVLESHREMPPVLYVGNGTTNGTPCQIRQCRFAIRDHGHFALTVPALRDQVMSELLCSRSGGLLHKAKPPAHIGAFNLADHDIQVAFLVLRPTSYMRTIEENGQW